MWAGLPSPEREASEGGGKKGGAAREEEEEGKKEREGGKEKEGADAGGQRRKVGGKARGRTRGEFWTGTLRRRAEYLASDPDRIPVRAVPSLQRPDPRPSPRSLSRSEVPRSCFWRARYCGDPW